MNTVMYASTDGSAAIDSGKGVVIYGYLASIAGAQIIELYDASGTNLLISEDFTNEVIRVFPQGIVFPDGCKATVIDTITILYTRLPQ